MSELIDKESLLDECLNHYEVGNIEQNCTMDWICKTVRNFPAASPWHRVEESPKKYGTYIVYWKDGEKFWWEKADWDEDWCTEEPNWYSYRDSRATIIEPDYWMPIEPPKE